MSPSYLRVTKKKQKKRDYREILSEYREKHNKALNPVSRRTPGSHVPSQTTCPYCQAPHRYIYFNDGKKRTQLRCKVCAHTFPLHQRFRKNRVDIFKIHHTDHILGLILTFYISFALSARKTALVLRMVFNIEVSHQTVLNYTQAVAYYAHQFNLTHKGPIDDISVGDETYIKIGGEQNYVWFCISASKRTITAYHLADDRETRLAVITLKEAFSTASPGQKLTFISDGLGSYTEGIHFLNSSRKHNKIKHIQVIGLKDKDDVSEQYRSFKQLIERFNRTYKHHVKPAVGFNSFNGAMALTVLFVTYYNFLKPHMSLNYRTPIQIHQLDGINTIQARWVKLLSMMY